MKKFVLFSLVLLLSSNLYVFDKVAMSANKHAKSDEYEKVVPIVAFRQVEGELVVNDDTAIKVLQSMFKNYFDNSDKATDLLYQAGLQLDDLNIDYLILRTQKYKQLLNKKNKQMYRFIWVDYSILKRFSDIEEGKKVIRSFNEEAHKKLLTDKNFKEVINAIGFDVAIIISAKKPEEMTEQK